MQCNTPMAKALRGLERRGLEEGWIKPESEADRIERERQEQAYREERYRKYRRPMPSARFVRKAMAPTGNT